MSDIVAKLRDWRSVHLARLHLLMDEAADEIERLRLTDKEREALDRVRVAYRDMDHNDMTMQQIEDYEAICDLLERTK